MQLNANTQNVKQGLCITVTVAEARKALGIGNTKLYELIGRGELRRIKLGRRTLIRTDSIRALVDKLEAA